mgnify:CR=1 FL=1
MSKSSKTSLIWGQKAQADLDRLYNFLAQHNPDAARRAIQAIENGADLLVRFPLIGRQMNAPDERELYVPFGKANYILRYYIAEDEIIILRAWHSRENRPGWADKA